MLPGQILPSPIVASSLFARRRSVYGIKIECKLLAYFRVTVFRTFVTEELDRMAQGSDEFAAVLEIAWTYIEECKEEEGRQGELPGPQQQRAGRTARTKR